MLYINYLVLILETSLWGGCSVQLLSKSNSLWPHRLQNARPPCPSPTPRVYSNSCLSSLWCHPTISSCHPLLLPPLIFPSIRVFSNKSVLLIRWPKDWSFSFSINPSNEYSFRMDWLDLLAVQGDSQESSPTSQSKSINNSVHSFLLEKEMATHSSTLAWKIPRLGEPGRLQSMGSQRVRHDWMTSLSFFL